MTPSSEKILIEAHFLGENLGGTSSGSSLRCFAKDSASAI